jgi:hypothetical protein
VARLPSPLGCDSEWWKGTARVRSVVEHKIGVQRAAVWCARLVHTLHGTLEVAKAAIST